MSQTPTCKPYCPRRQHIGFVRTCASLMVAVVCVVAISPLQAQEVQRSTGAASDGVLADRGMLGRLTQGAMHKFKFADTPVVLPQIVAADRNGARVALSQWGGRMVLLNIWASWCAPCRQEMPALARLRGQLAPIGIEVVTLSIDKVPDDALAFLQQLGLQELPALFDADMAAAKALGAQGAPISILIDVDGRELGRIEGAVDWDSIDALLLLKAIKLKTSEGRTKVGEPGAAAGP